MKANNRFVAILVTLTLMLGMVLGPAERSAQAADPITFNINSQNVVISADGDYIITGTGAATTNNILVKGSLNNVNITLSGVNINTSGTEFSCAFTIGSKSKVKMTLQGINKLSSGNATAGLNVQEGASLHITDTSTGSLVANGGSGASGIGANDSYNGGTVYISGGKVTATGGKYGSGIGGGFGSQVSNVNIDGGEVIAKGGIYGGAGIGAGQLGNGNIVNIIGGAVTATGGNNGAGIGGGMSGAVGIVNILGGTVTAAGGSNGAGIGSSLDGISGTITIYGGTVTATGGESGAGIGRGGNVSIEPTVTIKGGSVKVSSMNPAAYNSDGVQEYLVTISGLPAAKDVYYSINGDSPCSCVTDSSGKLYLWLPLTAEGSSTEIMISGIYLASGPITEGNNAFSVQYILPDKTGIIGTPYHAVLSPPLGPYPHSWNVDSLPAGLAIDPATGAISGTPSDTGVFDINVSVTDADGRTDMATFKLTIAQTLAIDLTGLQVSQGTLDPAFDKNQVAYSLNDTPPDMNSIDITATTEDLSPDPNSTITINGDSAESGAVKTVNLRQGANLIPIVVTSPDGLSQKSYILSVNGKVSDADLSSLIIAGQDYDPAEQSNSLSVDNTVNSLEIKAIPSDPKAMMVLNGRLLTANTPTSVYLAEGDNSLELMVVAQDASTKTYTINVNRGETLSITSNDLPPTVLNTPYSFTLAGKGGAAPYTWSSTNLPAWLSIDGTSGELSGTPSEGGSFTFTVELTDGSQTTSKDFTIETYSGTGIVGIPYHYVLSPPLGPRPHTWSAEGLPNGLTLNTATGAIEGTPTDTGVFDISVSVTDADGNTDTTTLILTIAQSLSIDLTDLQVNAGTLDPAFDKNQVAYSLNDTPPGMNSINITATTEDLSPDPNSTITINGESAESGAAITVNLNQGANLIPIVVTSPDGLSQKSYILSVNGKVSDSDLASLSIAGQTIDPIFDPATQSYSLSVGNTVDSLEIQAAPSDSKALMILDGSLLTANTPTSVNLAEGDNTLELMVVAQDASTKTYTITINRATSLSITSDKLPPAVLNSAYTFTLQGNGGAAPYTWSSTNLPAWLSIDGATGELSGTPTEGGSFTFTTQLTEIGGQCISKDFTVEVHSGTGNGAYTVIPADDPCYSAGLTEDGIPTMTVKQGTTGLKYFCINITPLSGHPQNEVVVFVQMRNGQQVGFNAVGADFDIAGNAQAAFNVQPGDIIKTYLVDGLSNDPAINPVIL